MTWPPPDPLTAARSPYDPRPLTDADVAAFMAAASERPAQWPAPRITRRVSEHRTAPAPAPFRHARIQRDKAWLVRKNERHGYRDVDRLLNVLFTKYPFRVRRIQRDRAWLSKRGEQW